MSLEGFTSLNRDCREGGPSPRFVAFEQEHQGRKSGREGPDRCVLLPGTHQTRCGRCAVPLTCAETVGLLGPRRARAGARSVARMGLLRWLPSCRSIGESRVTPPLPPCSPRTRRATWWGCGRRDVGAAGERRHPHGRHVGAARPTCPPAPALAHPPARPPTRPPVQEFKLRLKDPPLPMRLQQLVGAARSRLCPAFVLPCTVQMPQMCTCTPACTPACMHARAICMQAHRTCARPPPAPSSARPPPAPATPYLRSPTTSNASDLTTSNASD